MVAYWDQTPETDPFYLAVKFSASMNMIAAVLSGLSALCAGLKLFVPETQPASLRAMPAVRLIKHEVIPKCESFEVLWPELSFGTLSLPYLPSSYSPKGFAHAQARNRRYN
jgi:hypothetical protein